MDFAQFGVDAATVASLPTNGFKYPSEVPGRVAHIDADFMSYQVSAESKAELDPDDPTPRKTLEDMKHNAYEAVDHIRRLAGAQRAVLHVTHESDKGGRDDHAMLKPYQENRKNRENRPEQLDAIRVFLGSGAGDTTGRFTGVIHRHQEADDGMAQACYADPENAILCSADKDLNMVPFWRLDMYTDKIDPPLHDPFGYIEIDDSKSSKKLTGRGTKFFWAQCLMGDSADNISGLPAAPGKVYLDAQPTKAYTDAYNAWIAAATEADADKIQVKLDKLTAKTKLCGPVLTYDILRGCKSDIECYRVVKEAYILLEKDHGHEFVNYRTGKRITATQALLSEMRLLWMRRYDNKDDIIDWLKELANGR